MAPFSIDNQLFHSFNSALSCADIAKTYQLSLIIKDLPPKCRHVLAFVHWVRNPDGTHTIVSVFVSIIILTDTYCDGCDNLFRKIGENFQKNLTGVCAFYRPDLHSAPDGGYPSPL